MGFQTAEPRGKKKVCDWSKVQALPTRVSVMVAAAPLRYFDILRRPTPSGMGFHASPFHDPQFGRSYRLGAKSAILQAKALIDWENACEDCLTCIFSVNNINLQITISWRRVLENWPMKCCELWSEVVLCRPYHPLGDA
jgi:hypothetical protein